MDPERQYELLRHLTSPVVAVTVRSGDRRTGMIANSAIRASLVPDCPRVAFYCFKSNYSHELILERGRFCLHLLHRDQLNAVGALGLFSGRERDKLAELDPTETDSGLPRLPDAYALFDCRVVNAMDAGPSTFILGEADTVEEHPRANELRLLDAAYFREHAPEEWMQRYRENKRRAQAWAKQHLEVNPDAGPFP